MSPGAAITSEQGVGNGRNVLLRSSGGRSPKSGYAAGGCAPPEAPGEGSPAASCLFLGSAVSLPSPPLSLRDSLLQCLSLADLSLD